MKPNVNCLKGIFILVTSLLIVSTRISGGDQLVRMRVLLTNRVERENNCRQEDDIKKNHKKVR
jgi:hypothetical protein